MPDHLLLSDQSTDDTGSDAVSVTSCRPSLEDCAECRLYRAAEGRRRVVFVRHGETDFNLAGKIQGTLESQLTEKGHAQARAAGVFLAADLAGAVDRVLCSPKARTMATLDDIEAAFAAAGAALPERMVLEDLREIELTGWEGQCKKDIQRDDAAAWKAWKASPADFVFPSGFAPVPDLWDRVDSAWQYLLDSTPPGTTTLVVAHGAFNRTFLAQVCGLPISAYVDSDDGRFGFSNCGCAGGPGTPLVPPVPAGRRLVHAGGRAPDPRARRRAADRRRCELSREARDRNLRDARFAARRHCI